MGNNSVEDEEANAVMEVNRDRLNLMHQKISDAPKLLTKAAANSSCCIFKVPQRFIDINGKSYQPHIVSIGPYHHGEAHLRMIEEHKWRYLGSLLSRTQNEGVDLELLLKAIQPLEMKARERYSQVIHLGSDEFVEMMVLDGCFIIELFRKVGNVVEFEVDDPIVTMAWIIPFFYRDLLRLENQIPFFVLQCLFDITRMTGEESGCSLSKLALDFFNYALQRPDHIIARHDHLKAKHLLDLVRSSFIDFEQGQPLCVDTSTPMIHSVSKLRRAGIRLRQGNPADSFLVVKFKNGVIEMPTVTIDDTMSSFLLNCVAFEQCHNGSSKHFTTYATLLDCLVNTFKDVEYLCDCNIIENYFGTDSEVARFINDLGKEVAFDIERCYLSRLFSDVHNYYKNSWHVQWASFKYTYFNTPWSFISALVALIILLLTVAQTFYTIYGTYKK
ncbi:unnamed protein product [Dovyalis caffra]|uniref:Uncharacterized protein n=1 Tax=Dovyalis caffra TaxID=77055 RepID=A0AAV1RH04_9ROSI|nr:unnamed protein product [Dovyalis caffra]